MKPIEFIMAGLNGIAQPMFRSRVSSAEGSFETDKQALASDYGNIMMDIKVSIRKVEDELKTQSIAPQNRNI